MRQARFFYEASLAALRSQEEKNSGGRSDEVISSKDGVLTAMFLVATAVVPLLYDSHDHIAQVGRQFGLKGLQCL